MDRLDLNDYSSKKDRGYRYISLVNGYFIKFGCLFPLKNKNAQSITNSFENILKSSIRKTV